MKMIINKQGIVHIEIAQYLNGRYITPPERIWWLLENKMHAKSQSIMQMAVNFGKRVECLLHLRKWEAVIRRK